MMNENGVNRNMENNKTTEELTTEKQTEALQNWYKAKIKSRLEKREIVRILICNPTYELYNKYECPERMWFVKDQR